MVELDEDEAVGLHLLDHADRHRILMVDQAEVATVHLEAVTMDMIPMVHQAVVIMDHQEAATLAMVVIMAATWTGAVIDIHQLVHAIPSEEKIIATIQEVAVIV